ncbi:MAG: STAS/SEC14 domain-containing protein [Verrucomicrobia bacterium]|nr:MAG: STAS/SEC14 domain-containing protein [Verrucomicrobiota bacterium]
MIEILEESSGATVGFSLSGKLHDEDYKSFVPQMEDVIAREGKVRLLAHFHDFHGWDLHAAWDDMAFGAKHYADIEKVALVGDRKWEEWMAKVCNPFTRATVKYFDAGEIGLAWDWLHEEQSEAKGRTE